MPNTIGRLTGALLLLSAASTACTDITTLTQENPGQLSAGTLYVPRNAQLLVNGALIGPADALSCGFVDRVVPIDRVVPAAIEWARGLTALPPQACAATRRTVRASLTQRFHDVDARLFDHMTDVWFGQETQGAMQALVQRLAARKR